jgi:hypothetical protein
MNHFIYNVTSVSIWSYSVSLCQRRIIEIEAEKYE